MPKHTVSQDRLFEVEDLTAPFRYSIYARWIWITASAPMFKKQWSDDSISPAWLEWHWARGLDPFKPRPGRGRHLAERLRREVIERDGYVCGLCGLPVEPTDVHIDHILPVSLGGKDVLTNLQVAHGFCNMSKGARI